MNQKLIIKEELRNRSQLHFDRKVYHTKIYNGNKELKVVGIRKTEVELYGDYSGIGMGYGSQWLPLDGVLLCQ